jgi:hypothetical protein
MTRVKRGSTPVEMLQRLQHEGKLCGAPTTARRHVAAPRDLPLNMAYDE